MSKVAARILIVDDEPAVRTTLSAMLKRRGYAVTEAASGEEALDLIEQHSFDLLLLDLQMPGISGMNVAQQAHQLQLDTSILILTGHGSLETALDGIRLGVFDYLLKSSNPEYILERIAAALHQQTERRRQQRLMRTLQAVVGEMSDQTNPEPTTAAPSSTWLTIGNLQLSTWNQTVQIDGRMLNLTPTEFRILASLAQNTGHVVTYQELLQHGQGYTADSNAAAELIKPHIYHLRQKLEHDPSDPHYILTVRGTGYMLATPAVQYAM